MASFASITRIELPFELALAILQELAKEVPEKARELVLISRGVQRVIDPILYRTVVLGYRSASLFARTVRTAKTLHFYQHHVKIVCFAQWVPDYDDILTIISICNQVHLLAINQQCRSLSPLANATALYRLSVCLPAWDPDLHLNLAWLKRLTHLELLISDLSWTDFSFLLGLSLTHLALNLPEAPPLTKSLVVCVLYTSSKGIERLPRTWFRTCDPRIVLRTDEPLDPSFHSCDYVLQRKHQEFEKDWGRRPKGEPDAWEMAEQIVEARRASQQSSNNSL